jgi:hypothetical protein
VAVVALEHSGLIHSGDGEFPLYQLADQRPVASQGHTPTCTSCVGCGECPPDEPPEEAVYY